MQEAWRHSILYESPVQLPLRASFEDELVRPHQRGKDIDNIVGSVKLLGTVHLDVSSLSMVGQNNEWLAEWAKEDLVND